jgi:hypothetical protein
MRNRKIWLPLAMILSLAATGALAADADHDQHHPTPPATAAMPAPGTQGTPMASMPGSSGNMPMPGMMQMMMGQNSMAGHVEGRIAFLKAELKITDAQQPLWNTVAEAMRTNAKGMSGMSNEMPMMGSATRLPEKLAMHEKMMAGHLDGLRKLKAAVEPLYASFNADQKKTADELMIGPMGMMGVGM